MTKNGLVPMMDSIYLTRGHYIIIHCTCTCIVQMKKNGDSHLAGKKTWDVGPILTHDRTCLEGWQTVLYYDHTHAQELIGHFQMSWRWRQL